jgi:alkyldihydroxyacetonephosphate synthase
VCGGLVLDLTALARIREINEQAMTATVEAGLICDAFEADLNARGLTFPHYPASSWLGTVGGYISTRGSGVMSTRYGTIVDMVLTLEVVLPDGSVAQTLAVPRHAAGPDLTGLFIGAEGTLGVVTAATVHIKRLPAARRFRALSFPDLASGLEAGRRIMADGLRPPVMRLYDASAAAHSLSRVVGYPLVGPTAVLVFEGRPELADVEAALAVEHGLACRGQELDAGVSETWWNHRFDFYRPPHYPTLPAMWGTIDVVATFDRIMPAYAALQEAVVPRFAPYNLRLNTHLSHWYDWGTMLYARFSIPQAPDDPDDAQRLNTEIWEVAIDAALRAGAVINDHHGLGLKLAPFVPRQYGTAYPLLKSVKRALDPQGIMNPGKWLDTEGS